MSLPADVVGLEEQHPTSDAMVAWKATSVECETVLP